MLSTLCFAALLFVQDPEFPGKKEPDAADRRLPNGKKQSDAILKADFEKSLEDIRKITELSQTLLADMERDTSNVLSLNSIKKTEEIEKLARRVRGRMRRL